MSDADELEDELLQVAGRPRQGSKRARRTAADDSNEAEISDVGLIPFFPPLPFSRATSRHLGCPHSADARSLSVHCATSLHQELSSDDGDEAQRARPAKRRLTTGKGMAAPVESDDSEIDDGYDSDLMGDDDDREKLEKMTELDREMILAQRGEDRDAAEERRRNAKMLRKQSQTAVSQVSHPSFPYGFASTIRCKKLPSRCPCAERVDRTPNLRILNPVPMFLSP